MASKASSIQPSAAASSVRRWVDVIREKVRATEDAIRRILAAYVVTAERAKNAEEQFVFLRPPRVPPVNDLVVFLQEVEITVGFVNVTADLLFQGFHRGKLDLVPEAVEEMNFHLGLGLEFDWMKAEQVSLNRK